MNKFEYDVIKKVFYEIKNGKPGVDYCFANQYDNEDCDLKHSEIMVFDNNNILKPFTKMSMEILDNQKMLHEKRYLNGEAYLSGAIHVPSFHIKTVHYKDLQSLVEFGSPSISSSKEKSNVTNYFGSVNNLQLQQNTSNSNQKIQIDDNEKLNELIKQVFQFSQDIYFARSEDQELFNDLLKQLDTNKSCEKKISILKQLKSIVVNATTNVASTGIYHLLNSVLGHIT